MNNSIFAKKSNNNNNNNNNNIDDSTKIDIESIKSTIPPSSFRTRQPLLEYHMVESRWRILNIPINCNNKIIMKKMVEISKKHPDSPRQYLAKNMEWIDADISPEFDDYVIEEYYYYSCN
jgi:hypothetical protein